MLFRSVNKTVELAETHGWYYTRQFENEANPDMHSATTAREIVDDFADVGLDYWVTGYGTGGTLNGVGRVLRAKSPKTKIVVCEPDPAPMLSSGQPQPRNPDGTPTASHPPGTPPPQQGWSPDFIPKLAQDAVDTYKIDRVLRIPNPEAMSRRATTPTARPPPATRRGNRTRCRAGRRTSSPS